MVRRLWIVPSLLLLMSGCGADSVLAPSDPPSIRGTITAVDESGRIRVEENPSDEAGSAKAVVRITADTRVLDANGRLTTRAALTAGIRVAAWFRGPVAESYPVQATASVVAIEP